MEYTPAVRTEGGVIRRHHFEVGVKRTTLRVEAHVLVTSSV
jgi:hypothetical protein